MATPEMENVQLHAKLDEVQNLTRLDNVVIHGLAEPTKETSSVGKTATSSSKPQSNYSSIPEIIELCTTSLYLHIV